MFAASLDARAAVTAAAPCPASRTATTRSRIARSEIGGHQRDEIRGYFRQESREPRDFLARRRRRNATV
jgi:hypothetical protein